jgi:hypothetical protein
VDAGIDLRHIHPAALPLAAMAANPNFFMLVLL